VISDELWDVIEPVLPSDVGRRGQRWSDHRMILEGIIWRYRVGAPWRDLPPEFGPWQTVWKRHRRFSADGTWDKIHQALLAQADHAGEVDWTVSVDSTINRAHQHATNLPREKADTVGGLVSLESPAASVVGVLAGDTGG
jgi:transposase